MKEQTKIYVSAVGNDLNDGFTEAAPIKTLAKAAELAVTDDTAVLLEGGGVYSGSLYFDNISNLSVGSYGIGIPVIKSGGQSAIHLVNCRNAVISKLKLCGEGFRILNNTSGVHAEKCEQLLVNNVEASAYHKAGIKLTGCSDSEVIGCFAHDNGAVGIVTGEYEDIFCKNIRVAHCKVYDNAGDYTNRWNHSGSGIIFSHTLHSVVEFCEAAGNGWAQRQCYVNGPVGIWCCCGCEDIIFRYNIARYNRTQPGAVDGDGLDIDGEVKDSVMEYNYTYKNEGSGYLLCEFWGDSTDTLWENNITRYNVSIEDDTRIGKYGAVTISAPSNIPFEKMYINNNFFVAGKTRHSVYNGSVPESAKDLFVTNNILVSDGTPCIEDPKQPYVHMENNICIENNAERKAVITAAPMLTDPRELLRQPVFNLLKEGLCYEVLNNKGVKELFRSRPKPVYAMGYQLMELQLYGPDMDGTEKSGDVALYYDSLRPGVVTKLAGTGAEMNTPIPWWEKDKRYVARITTRLQSPDVEAYFFIRDENGIEQRKYINGTIADYRVTEMEFIGNDKWFDKGKYLGVKLVSGEGSLYIHSIEFIELPAGSDYSVGDDLIHLEDFRSFGDCWQSDNSIIISGGSYLERTVQAEYGHFGLTLTCHCVNSGGFAFIRTKDRIKKEQIFNGDNHIVLEAGPEWDLVGSKVTFGIVQNCFDMGTITVNSIAHN